MSGVKTTIAQLKFQQSLTKVLNQAVLDFAQSNLAECAASARQAFQLIVQRGSALDVAGDFRVEQEAKLVLACLQRQTNSSELIMRLETEIKKKLSDDKVLAGLVDVELGGLGVQISDTDIKNIVETGVKLSNDSKCIANVSQNGTIQITDGSRVTVGLCQLAAQQVNKDVCLSESENLSAEDRSRACKAVADCGARGNLFFSQLIGLSGSCDQMQSIVSKITQDISTKVDEQIKASTETKGLESLLIAGAVVLALLAIIGIIFLIIRSKVKKDAQQMQKKGGSNSPYLYPQGQSYAQY